MKIRTALMASLEMADWPSKVKGVLRKVKTLRILLQYGIERNRSPRGAKPVDIPETVKKWVEVVAGLSTAHSKDDYDAADARTEELFGPILNAPVKQLREFYPALLEALRADQRIPFMVVMGFEAWGHAVVETARDEGVKRLRSKLAGEIADLVELDAKEQLPEAIKRALRWRDPERLREIKERVESGEKVKMKGRESCLFLEVGRGKNKVEVML